MHALWFSWHIAEYAKKPLVISAVSLRYLICHSVCFSSTLLRFGGFNGCRKWGSWPRGVRRCRLTGVVKMLCGSCWKRTELGGWDVNGGEGKGGRCLGRLDGETLETLVWCSAVRSKERVIRSGQSRYSKWACSPTGPSHLFPITFAVQREAWASRNQGRT